MEGYERVNRVFSLMEDPERGPFLEGLARFVKRLHSTCFYHADLWARNILVKDKRIFSSWIWTGDTSTVGSFPYGPL